MRRRRIGMVGAKRPRLGGCRASWLPHFVESRQRVGDATLKGQSASPCRSVVAAALFSLFGLPPPLLLLSSSSSV